MKNFKIVLIILIIGIISSAFPLGYLGMMCGLPSVIVNTIILCFVFKKELFEGN